MASIIFQRNDSHNVCRKVELFVIWYTLMGTCADTGAFIICYLMEVVKTTHKNVIGVGGTIMTIIMTLPTLFSTIFGSSRGSRGEAVWRKEERAMREGLRVWGNEPNKWANVVIIGSHLIIGTTIPSFSEQLRQFLHVLVTFTAFLPPHGANRAQWLWIISPPLSLTLLRILYLGAGTWHLISYWEVNGR